MPTRDEPILGDVSAGTIRALPQWRCTVPIRSTTMGELDDPHLRLGTYVHAATAEGAAQLLVEHERLRSHELIDVQPWCAAGGKPLSSARRREVISVRAGYREPKLAPRS